MVPTPQVAYATANGGGRCPLVTDEAEVQHAEETDPARCGGCPGRGRPRARRGRGVGGRHRAGGCHGDHRPGTSGQPGGRCLHRRHRGRGGLEVRDGQPTAVGSSRHLPGGDKGWLLHPRECHRDVLFRRERHHHRQPGHHRGFGPQLLPEPDCPDRGRKCRGAGPTHGECGRSRRLPRFGPGGQRADQCHVGRTRRRPRRHGAGVRHDEPLDVALARAHRAGRPVAPPGRRVHRLRHRGQHRVTQYAHRGGPELRSRTDQGRRRVPADQRERAGRLLRR